MSDLKTPAATTKGGKPNAPVPFEPETAGFTGKQLDFVELAPRAEAEPPIEKGIDLAGRGKIIFAAGRGKTGKTTLLRWITEISLERGGSPLLADIDATNASFASYFGNVARPKTDSPTDVMRWLQKLIEHCINNNQSAIVDLGGGDTTLRTLATEMPGLASHIEAAGLVPVIFYLAGTQPEDLTPALTLAARGFSPKAQALVLNEFAIDAGSSRQMAFARQFASTGFQTLANSCVRLWMPRLFAADEIESRQCRFLDARDRQVTPPLGLFDSARVRIWLDQMNTRFAGISSWIP